jgi:nicotinamidase-related amidase
MRAIIENRLKGSAPLSPANTGILAIHWQNDIVLPTGAFGSIFAESVRQTGALMHAAHTVRQARLLGAQVFHVLAAYHPDFRGHVANNALFRTVEQRHAFVRGTPGWEVCAEMRPEHDDIVVEHTRISAFYGTDLSAQLRAAGVVNLAITGVATNVAVDLTVRDAVQDGFNTYLLEDACCSSTPAFHDAAMMTMAALSSHVIKHDRFLELLGGAPGGAAEA